VKLLFDENVSPALVEWLSDLFPDSKHVHECGLGGADDTFIWRYARDGDFALVSKDADFAEKAVREPNSPKFILLRMGNCTALETEELLRRNAILIQHFYQNPSEVFLVLGNLYRK